MAHLFAQPHDNYNLNVEQPSLRTIKNQVEWKYDNYRIKEITSIETGRRGTDEEWAVLHTCVVGKNLGGISRD